MTQAWNETGATWNCPEDTDTGNSSPDCTQWDMNDSSAWPFLEAPTQVTLHENNQTGWVEWDVTADVAAFLAGIAINHGWIVKKVDEGQNGRVDYSSREGAFAPELVITVNGPAPPATPTISDTYVKSGSPNQNQGSETVLRVRSSGHNRALVAFDQAEIADRVGAGSLVSAKLRLNIIYNASNWGSAGREVAVHRLSQAWNEVGATWNCPDDDNTQNQSPDCTGSGWEMNDSTQWPFVPTPTSTILHQNNQLGAVEWDVTPDVAAFLAGSATNYGWVVKKVEEGQSGHVLYSSSEGTAPPELILDVAGGVLDADGDGVPDTGDQCPDTPTGETVDANGCSASQLDADGDGVPDAGDQCPGTPTGETVDANGCTPLQIDTDGDGHPDVNDTFPNDPNEWVDLDGDGVGDNSDPDRDGDGVDNSTDLFPDNPAESSDLDGDGIGDNADPDRDGDGVANDDDFFPDDPAASTVPQVIFTSPDNLTTVGVSPIEVTGTIDDPDAMLTVNGVPVIHSGGTFSASVTLEEGHNAVVARAVDTLGHEGTDSLNISLDKTPPYITIESPPYGATVSSDVIAVTGLVNDIVRGTITDQDAVVTVNGIQASVSNRTYLAEGVSLVEGINPITVSASDAVGNTASITTTVIYDPPVGAHIELIGGQGQGGRY